ncbi:hypothetical protein [Methylosinus sporium]|uniref:hypothetical protein n=1 Tax=Methylosinus sporium TaxID=428 RepID=UPI001305003D|nr:hypothetical protein [Methylosinus sporium]
MSLAFAVFKEKSRLEAFSTISRSSTTRARPGAARIRFARFPEQSMKLFRTMTDMRLFK